MSGRNLNDSFPSTSIGLSTNFNSLQDYVETGLYNIKWALDNPDPVSTGEAEIFDTERKRLAIRALAADQGWFGVRDDSSEEAVTLKQLTKEVTAAENGKDKNQVTSKERSRVYSSLHQGGLQSLDEYGVISYDEEEKICRPGPAVNEKARKLEDVERYLDAKTSTEDSEDENPQLETSTVQSLDQDAFYHILKYGRSRGVIDALRVEDLYEDEGIAKSELADLLAEVETDGEEFDSSERKTLYTALHQTHLPRLDEVNAIERQRDIVSPGENYGIFARYVDEEVRDAI